MVSLNGSRNSIEVTGNITEGTAPSINNTDGKSNSAQVEIKSLNSSLNDTDVELINTQEEIIYLA